MWTDIRSFVVAVPIEVPDARLAEEGIQNAVKVRNALMLLCQDRYRPDEILQSIDSKRRAGNRLTDEEAKYIRQSEAIYLRMVCDKMEIALFYEADFFALSPEERHALYRLVERYPGCSLVSGRQGIGDRLVHRMNPKRRVTDNEAQQLLRKFLLQDWADTQ
jgi:hypothetical protein